MRNLGWVTREEQQILRRARVAIAGLGGVGGTHALALARLGIERFKLMDPDVFELKNFNRQPGADLGTIGRIKVEVIAERLRQINPECEIETNFSALDESNLPQFMQNVDLFIDGLDSSALDAREKAFAYAHAHGIPAITAAPIGMGAAMMTFLPNHMSFEEFFGFHGRSKQEKFSRLILGLTPSFMHLPALVDRSSVNVQDGNGPSTVMGCMIAGGMLCTEVLKIILGRGRPICAPRSIHFDAYAGKLKTSRMRWGHRNPIFQLKLSIFKMLFQKKMADSNSSQPKLADSELVNSSIADSQSAK